MLTAFSIHYFGIWSIFTQLCHLECVAPSTEKNFSVHLCIFTFIQNHSMYNFSLNLRGKLSHMILNRRCTTLQYLDHFIHPQRSILLSLGYHNLGEKMWMALQFNSIFHVTSKSKERVLIHIHSFSIMKYNFV